MSAKEKKTTKTGTSGLRGLWKVMRGGLIDNNPTFVQLLGMCPTLATTTSVKNAVGMGLAATAVLTCSNLLISLLRRFIPKQVRISAYVVIISGFVTSIELLMKAYFYELYGALGLFIPLIVVNCIILARAEAFASKNPVLPSLVDGFSMGLGFTCALTIIASVREVLGAGTFLGFRLFGESFSPAIIFILPAGAFLTLGFLIAGVQYIRNRREDKKRIDRLSDVSSITGIPASVAYAAEADVREAENGTETGAGPGGGTASDPDSEPGFVLDFYPPEEGAENGNTKASENKDREGKK